MPLLPSLRLAALVALAGTAFIIDSTFALLLNAALLVLIAADAGLLFRQHPVRVTRSAPARVALGGTAEVSVSLHAAAAAHVQWTDDHGSGIEREGGDRMTVDIPAGATVTQQYQVGGVTRGRTHLGDVHLRVLGPLGLLWRRQRTASRAEITVQPGLRELQHRRLLALQQRSTPGVRRTREIGEGREFERLREYVRGDDPRRLDWKATARRGSLIVRQYEAERSQSIMIAIDAGRVMAERFGGRDRLDHALAAALVLADAAAVHGDAVGVMLFADRVQAFVPPARNPLSRIADALATVEARRVEPDYPAAFRHLRRRLRRRSLVVLFSDVIDARASSAVLEHLSASAARHLPLIVAMRNPELQRAAEAPAADEAAAFRRAAAEELMQARAVALAGVRRRGVLVADVEPDAGIAEVVARYVEVKQRGLL